MKCLVFRDDLLPVAKLATRIIPARGTIPVLACLKIEADAAGCIHITSTDMDLTYTGSVGGEREARATGGTVIVQARPFLHFVKSAPNGCQVEIEALPTPEPIMRPGPDGQRIADRGAFPAVTLRAGRNHATVNGVSPDDFPAQAKREFRAFDMPAETLRGALAAVSHAMSTETTRYYLNGVYLHAGAGELVAVATDGHRMGRISVPVPAETVLSPHPNGVIVPAAAVRFLEKWLAREAGPVAVALSMDRARIRFNIVGGSLLTRIVDGFPDYERVIPSANNVTVEFATAALTEFLNGHKCTVAIECVPGSVRACIRNSDTGDVDTEIEAAVSAPITIGFDAHYLREELKRAGIGPYASVKLALADAGSPALLTSRDRPGEIHVLMPRRI